MLSLKDLQGLTYEESHTRGAATEPYARLRKEESDRGPRYKLSFNSYVMKEYINAKYPKGTEVLVAFSFYPNPDTLQVVINPPNGDGRKFKVQDGHLNITIPKIGKKMEEQMELELKPVEGDKNEALSIDLKVTKTFDKDNILALQVEKLETD